MNGFELYQELKKKDNKIKVCFITAFPDYFDTVKETFPDLMIECYIRKPIDFADLLATVKDELDMN